MPRTKSPSRLRSSQSEEQRMIIPPTEPAKRSTGRSASRKSVERTVSQKSTRRSASRSRTRSRSRSRARSKSRGRSATRKAKRSPSPANRARASPKRSRSSSRQKLAKTPSTPTRKSARVAASKESLSDREGSKRSGRSSSARGSGRKQTESNDASELPMKSEFGGSFGVAVLIFALPALVILINLACGKVCTICKIPKIPKNLDDYFECDAFALYLGWLVFHFILAKIPVGRVVSGQPIKGGKKLQYRCNGFFAFLASVGCLWLACYMGFPVADVYDIFLQLAVAAITTSVVVSLLLFAKARNISKSQRSEVGNTGNAVYDFFMGRELYPRVLGVDLKFVCELRPGLIGWVMLNLVFVAKACKETNGHPNAALLMVTAFQAWYVIEALWFEEAILTTMDITHDGFGFMLVFGDLAWVPFLYCLQGKFLLEHPQEWSNISLAAIFGLNLIGYIIFRGSNSQKNRFRTNPYDPTLAYLETIPTASGKRLLVSGWWGLCRHPNYLGDLIMALAWSIPCGFSHILPFFYPIYFLILLVNRAKRDDRQCRRKYGAAWERYCQRVPYRIFPYIY